MFTFHQNRKQIENQSVLKWFVSNDLCVPPVATTTPPELPRPELWITVSLLLLITTVSVCGLMVFLCFRRAHCRLRNVEDHDVTMLKVPSGDDPTYGVRDI